MTTTGPGRGRKGKNNLLVFSSVEPVEDSSASPGWREDAGKLTILKETEDDPLIEQPVPAKMKRRPVKAAPIETPNKSSVEAATPPKKRGRAPKLLVETRVESRAEQPKSEKRSRPGRKADKSMIKAIVSVA